MRFEILGGGRNENLFCESFCDDICLADHPKHNVCEVILRAIVRLRLAVDKPDEGGIAGHVEPVSESFSSRRADRINRGHHGIIAQFLELCSGGGVLRSKRLAMAAPCREKVN
jgi:hypothetical protein